MCVYKQTSRVWFIISRPICHLIAKFHYTDATGPGSPTKSAHVVEYELNSTTRTRTRTRHGPNGVSPQKSPCGSVRVRSGPCRVRVVEFSSSPTMCADFVRVGSGPCRVRVVKFSYNGAALFNKLFHCTAIQISLACRGFAIQAPRSAQSLGLRVLANSSGSVFFPER